MIISFIGSMYLGKIIINKIVINKILEQYCEDYEVDE